MPYEDKFGKRVVWHSNSGVERFLLRAEFTKDEHKVERIYLRCARFFFPIYLEDVLRTAWSLIKLYEEVMKNKALEGDSLI